MGRAWEGVLCRVEAAIFTLDVEPPAVGAVGLKGGFWALGFEVWGFGDVDWGLGRGV